MMMHGMMMHGGGMMMQHCSGSIMKGGGIGGKMKMGGPGMMRHGMGMMAPQNNAWP